MGGGEKVGNVLQLVSILLLTVSACQQMAYVFLDLSSFLRVRDAGAL